MPTTPSKTLSPAELAKLEHAFATDPASDAYKALAEAYLGMGRFMEAMVVCKKGVKAHPTSAEPRVLLARVYAEQGKDKKALEELQAGLQSAPGDKAALRMLGAIQLKTGEADAGRDSLLKAFAADPSDAETLEVLKQNNIAPPAAAAPAPVAAAPVAAAPVAAAPVPVAAAPSASGVGPPILTPGHGVPVAAPVAPGVWAQPGAAPQQQVAAQPAAVAQPAAQPAPRPSNGAVRSQPQQAARPAQRPVARPKRPAYDEDDDPMSEEIEVPRRATAKKSSGKGLFFGLLVIVPLAIGGYAVWGKYTAQRNREIKKSLDEASEQLKSDSYASYKKACEAAEKVLELDPESVAAHGYLAYAWAIRYGEHGGGDDARKKAEDHLAAARGGGEISSHLYAAEALFKTYSGKTPEALKELDERVKQFEADGKRSSLLTLTLGLIQMNAGDLERARESLEKAQGLAPDDPRVYAAIGTLYRRRGQDNQAWKSFDFALRYAKDHPESLLGKALLMLEQEDAQYYVGAAKMIQKLTDADPPPSPRQLATAHLARAFLISRVSNDLQYYKEDFQKELLEGTRVPADKKKAQEELAKEEELGFTLDRNNPELHLIKGRRLVLENEVEPAVAEIRKAIQMDATRAQFYVELARALMKKKGGEKEAAEALTTAIKTMGNSPKLVQLLGQAYQRQGQLDKALEQYQLALGDGKSKAPDARFALGVVLREKKDYAKSAEHLDKAAQEYVGQDTRVAASYTELARTLEARGDKEKAGETYQRALKADPEYADAYFFFARYLAQERGGADKAKLAAREYLRREPKGEHAQDAQRLAQ